MLRPYFLRHRELFDEGACQEHTPSFRCRSFFRQRRLKSKQANAGTTRVGGEAVADSHSVSIASERVG
jgi:hypothetical protein